MKKLILFLLFSISISAQNSVKLKTENGELLVPVELNNSVKINLMLDTGCTKTTLPFYVVFTLVKNGTITKKDRRKSQTYVMANGETTEYEEYILHSIKIGGKEIKNIEISVSSNVNSPLLLGNNVLKELGTITIDYKNLILEWN